MASAQAMEAFRAGVTATLRSWSALRAAVEQEWGGVESKAKADDLRQNIYDVMDGRGPPRISLEELEDNLATYLSDEFSIVLEDNSERQVASVIWKMYEESFRGDTTMAHQVVAAAGTVLSTPIPISVQDDDDDDDVMDVVEEEIYNGATESSGANVNQAQAATLTAVDYASGSLFGGGPPKPAKPSQPVRQLGESVHEKPKEAIDDDGFVTVPTRRKR